MAAASKATEVEIEGRVLRLTNLDKVLYPEVGFTKGAVIDYYRRVAPVLLPHIADRPLTLKRYPNGVDAPFFYEKQCPSHRPDWMTTVEVQHRSRRIEYCVVNELAALVWVANLASLEVHPFLATGNDVSRPTKLTLDLDPGEGASIVECCQVALLIREVMDEFGVQVFAKTSGSKGMQLEVPLNGPDVTYDETKAFARALAGLLEKQHPKLVVSAMEKAARHKKVFIDWSQNDDAKTTVSVYSLRARTLPTVSTPVTWDEVDAGADGASLVFDTEEAFRRVEQLGDLQGLVLSLRQELPRFD